MKMLRFLLVLPVALALGTAAPPPPQSSPTASTPAQTSGAWRAPQGLDQIRLWPGPVPDGTFRPQPSEHVEARSDPKAPGGTTDLVFDVADPTMTIVSARGRNTGTAVVVFPGGGFRMLFMGLEGLEICDWLTARGITCILSKYRVPGGNDFWDPELKRRITPAIPRALQDAQRTIRLVRSRAAELGIDPHRIGVLGMSAGGYLVAQTSTIERPTYRPVDAIDRISSRPDFAIGLYPGHICRDDGKTFDPALPVSGAAPPTFLVQAWDDQTDPICNSLMYAAALDKAGVSTEVHLFARGGHAFAMRHPDEPVGEWPRLVERWLGQIGML